MSSRRHSDPQTRSRRSGASVRRQPRKCHEFETDHGDFEVRQPETRWLQKIDMSPTVRTYGHEQRLSELARRALLAWLRERHQSWPNTLNRHVLVSRVTALGTEPVSHYYLKKHLLLRGVHLEQIRADRVLHEALANGPDPLRLAEMFNMHPGTAVSYANIAASLLERPIEQAAASEPGT